MPTSSAQASPYLRWGLILGIVSLGLCVVVLTGRTELRVVRFATYNTNLSGDEPGSLLARLRDGDPKARAVAEMIQRVEPDVLLLSEFDYDDGGVALQLFLGQYLGVSQNGASPIEYRYRFLRPVNSGTAEGLDLDGDGQHGGPGDVFGDGQFPGQFGMVLLSRYPIFGRDARTFRELPWRALPDSRLPAGDGADRVDRVPLSSKSHWDVPVMLSEELMVRVLASHPTNKNPRRHQDEVEFWVAYLSQPEADYIVDDDGQAGGLAAGQPFVLMGDLNADPVDGGDQSAAVRKLLENQAINQADAPADIAGYEASRQQWGVNSSHRGNPAEDTADLPDQPGEPGNLRLDYILPSANLEIVDSGVFWSKAKVPPSAHQLVWLDVRVN